MRKLIFGLFLLLISTSCAPIVQDVSYEKGAYEINTYFVESAVSCAGNNRVVYDETIRVNFEDLEEAKKSEKEKAHMILNQMKGKEVKKESNW